MTPQAQSLLNRLNTNYKKAAFFSTNYELYVRNGVLPKAGIVNEDVYLPADGWNSGHNRRIFIPKHTGVILILPKYTYTLGVGGTDTDKLKGLWASKFQYGYGQGFSFEPEGDFVN